MSALNNTKQWHLVNHQVPVSPTQYAQSATVVQGEIYIIGGGTITDTGHVASHEVYRYDPQLDTWEQKASMPTARYCPQLIPVGTKIFAVGGIQNNAVGVLKAFEVYDTEQDEWQKLPDAPRPSDGSGCALVEGRIYLCGGQTGIGTISNHLHVYDIETGVWTQKADLKRGAAGFVNLSYDKGELYFWAGSTSAASWNCAQAAQKYNIAEDKWYDSVEMPFTPNGVSRGNIQIGNRVYFAGITTEAGNTSSMMATEACYTYDLECDAWEELPGLPCPLIKSCPLVATKDTLYILDSSISSLFALQINHRQLRLLLEQGESQQLAGILLPAGVTVEDVDWSSADASTVQVDENGLATGIRVGKAVVTVTAKDGSWSDSILIQVLEAEVEPEYRLSILLKTGETCRLAASDNFEESFIWTSDDLNVATVSNSGKVTAVSPGVTVITVMSEDGGFQDQVWVKVED